MDYASPSSSPYPLSPTSTTPSSVFPFITPTTSRSTFVNISRRSSGKRIAEALNTAKMTFVGGTPNCYSTYSSTPQPYIVHDEHQPSLQSLSSPRSTFFGPLSRLREHLPHKKSPNQDFCSPSPPQRPISYFGKTPQRPEKNESRCLQSVLPGIFIAFEDDTLAFQGTPADVYSEEELRTPEGQRFTHHIKIRTFKSQYDSPEIKYSVDSHKASVLRLTVPRHSHDAFEIEMQVLAMEAEGRVLSPQEAERLYNEYGDIAVQEGITLLTSKQLLEARNFMYAAHYSFGRRSNGARILITAPRDHRTDIISAFICYAAYASRHNVLSIIHGLNEMDTLLGVWKYAISDDAVGLLQEIVNLVS
ncbi:hypothetical protein BT96DRAFT_971577 [Gymnopus androsaceus JB14]|uniref:Uncharacterized protein n=1 Tax=Gymnopus androsaceus JB14 TaxID=1447944 RepID=A0A6A4ICU2_9AGAR|nr:hypothetical protein BT96DRAFT_971577 [Gymnopus androsaceus JB14]